MENSHLLLNALDQRDKVTSTFGILVRMDLRTWSTSYGQLKQGIGLSTRRLGEAGVQVDTRVSITLSHINLKQGSAHVRDCFLISHILCPQGLGICSLTVVTYCALAINLCSRITLLAQTERDSEGKKILNTHELINSCRNARQYCSLHFTDRTLQLRFLK